MEYNDISNDRKTINLEYQNLVTSAEKKLNESLIASAKVRIGTRGSVLARWQAEWVAAELQKHGVTTELVLITTSGDAEQKASIGEIGTQGVFTKEIQRALLDDRVDLAVHSLKDLPTAPVTGLSLAAVPEREVVDDVLVSHDGKKFAELPAGAKIGTGSARRVSQLRLGRPELEYLDIRGNVDTRLKKVESGEYDAIVLAAAGLTRLGLKDRITEYLPRALLLPAIGQGALGLETRTDDAATRAILNLLNHSPSHAAVLAERALLHSLRGGCLAPIGAWGRIGEDGELYLKACVLSIDGTARIGKELQIEIDLDDETDWRESAIQLGEQLAAQLIEGGAERLIQAARK
jgi:hydroxymethylbilane synthase